MLGVGLGQMADQRAQGRIVGQVESRLATSQAHRVDPGQQAHGRGLHIAFHSGNLPGQEEIGPVFHL